jgi:hypothetical protein
MTPVILKNADGTIRAFIHHLHSHRTEIRNANGEPLGWYNPVGNITYQINGNMVGFGDLLTSLI